jgi:hypothetical protein
MMDKYRCWFFVNPDIEESVFGDIEGAAIVFFEDHVLAGD